MLKPGGRFGVAAWRPEGSSASSSRRSPSTRPPPPEGFQPPPLWGVRDHVTEIFEATGVELSFEDADAHWRFDRVDEIVEEYTTKFGPIVMLRASARGRGPLGGAASTDLRAMYEEVTSQRTAGSRSTAST